MKIFLLTVAGKRHDAAGIEHVEPIFQGYDSHNPDRPALVFDLMEPLRPIVDRKVLEFVQAHTFHPGDFTIRTDGVCRINPEMARQVVVRLSANWQEGSIAVP